MRRATDGAAFCAAPDRGSDQHRKRNPGRERPRLWPGGLAHGRSGSFTSWVPGALFVAKVWAAFPATRARECDALSVRRTRHFDASKHRHDHASARRLAGDQDEHLVALQPGIQTAAHTATQAGARDAPSPIVRERWRTSRFPSVPSALRDLDLRHALPSGQHLPERPSTIDAPTGTVTYRRFRDKSCSRIKPVLGCTYRPCTGTSDSPYVRRVGYARRSAPI